MSTNSKLYDYSFATAKTYLYAALFIAGNLLLPQLAHFVPNGGPAFLPIYFFTLIAAYKYGIRTGLLTAVLSPVINSMLFGMPVVAMLPIILIKSSLLAIAAAYAARYFQKVSLPILLLVVLSYQIVGTLIEWAMVKDFMLAVQDFRIGLPGMGLQVVGGYFLLTNVKRLKSNDLIH